MPPKQVLNIGGGFKDNSLFSEIGKTVNEAIKDMEAAATAPLSVMAEPGRFFAETVFTLVTNVFGKRVRGDRREYWIENGICGAFNPTVYDCSFMAFKPLLLSDHGSKEDKDPCGMLWPSTIFGPTCDAMDVVATDCKLPELQVNDLVVFYNMGAYRASTGTKFNGFDTLSTPPTLYIQGSAERSFCAHPQHRREQRGGRIPVVRKKGGLGSRINGIRSGLFTLFVDNIPNSMDPKGLFYLFQKFGLVRDVFILQKKRKATNSRFGFVKFDCSLATKVAIQKANGLWVDDKKLAVKNAEFGMERKDLQSSHQNHARGSTSRGVVMAKGKEIMAQFRDQRNYAEVVDGKVHLNKPCTIVRVMEEGIGWLYESIIIRLHAIFSIQELKVELRKKGIKDVLVRNGGG
ncbi:hypothetical protein ACSBR1_001644 [Camellia fascicularis]